MPPCPHCGSTRRTFAVAGTAGVEVTASLSAVVIRVGLGFAIGMPTGLVVHVPPPERGLHPQASPHDIVGAGTEILLVGVVFLILRRMQLRLGVRPTEPPPRRDSPGPG